MGRTRTRVRTTIAVAGGALAMALAIPMQAGVAHASTPAEDLDACISQAMANVTDAGAFGTAIDGCVNAYLQALGAGGDGGVTINTGILGTADDGGINTGILGTAEG